MLRAATEDDVEAIRRWRNHPEVRRHFIHTAVIEPEQHRLWWKRVQADPSARVLVHEHAGTPAGVVTITGHDPVARTAEWGFFLDVDGLRDRGTLFGAWVELERAAIRYAFGELGLSVLGGRTLSSNAAVLELHRRHGFVPVPERCYTVEIDGRPAEVVWMERRAASA
ncbi:GNAT family N-acetyltransferase [Spirilliplanes yamanashiensis]|uniref:N-acetyltransferase domain-containing protein n=1 Tax=Spirilliplanes yamanashiensis TaxID=42233 RepID=A0A8J4DLH2_9ACTN|nr:GNAT family N-acetyltransferase [Spirilliplanes yamanashiensis]MDP9816469.1 RimJ/RimL family protein N-acetyltransferase [Spirilliplanes yamanashiensis]GIJ05996.1 hypothetical protein Sya03_53480 [Spirilliplanes yamanashiensis]